MDPEPEYDLVTAFEGGQQIQGRHEYGNITARPPVPTLLETSGRMENQWLIVSTSVTDFVP